VNFVLVDLLRILMKTHPCAKLYIIGAPIPENMKERRNVTLDEDLLDVIEENRGLVPFSAFLNDILRRHFHID